MEDPQMDADRKKEDLGRRGPAE